MTNKYCIWYPSGGFGHFVNAVLTLYGKDFARPESTEFQFSRSGNSHGLELVAPKFKHNQPSYDFVFDAGKNYSILIDNGINDESTGHRRFFEGAVFVKVCYSDHSWPVVARTVVEKTMNQTISQHLTGSDFDNNWPESAPWSERERFYLYLRDHDHRLRWREDSTCFNLHLDDIIDYGRLYDRINQLVTVDAFDELHSQWHAANDSYLSPIIRANNVLKNLDSNLDLLGFSLWDQAVVNYYIWLKYQFEVPANDYANWFANTQEIAIMLQEHGITL